MIEVAEQRQMMDSDNADGEICASTDEETDEGTVKFAPSILATFCGSVAFLSRSRAK